MAEYCLEDLDSLWECTARWNVLLKTANESKLCINVLVDDIIEIQSEKKTIPMMI